MATYPPSSITNYRVQVVAYDGLGEAGNRQKLWAEIYAGRLLPQPRPMTYRSSSL